MTVGITELPPEGMQLGGVALAGDVERGTKTTEGLSLLFTTAGITVQGPQPQIERLLVWSGLDSANCSEKIALPDGRNAAVMELTSGGQAIRFLLPLDTVTLGQAAYLDQALPAWLARYKGPTTSATVAAPPAAAAAAPAPPAAAPPAPAPRAPAPPTSATGANAPGSGRSAGAVTAATGGSSAATAATNGTAHEPPAPAPGPSPAPTSFLPPPPPPGPASGPAGAAAPPPPPAGQQPFSKGTLPPPPPAGTSWENPPLSQPGPAAEEPATKSRAWRKSRTEQSDPPRSAPIPPPGAVAPVPPPGPPSDPVPLKSNTLPPPPPKGAGGPVAPGAVVWTPPIDPITGEALWDGSPSITDKPPAKSRGWRKGAKTGAVAAAGAASAAAMAERSRATTTTAAVETGASSPVPATPRTPSAPDASTPAPPAAPAGTEFDTSPFAGVPSPAPAPEPATESLKSAEPRPPRSNQRLVAVLVVVLVILLAGIGYFAYKKSNNSTTTATTVASPPVAPPAIVATALAASVNLRIGDLPSGWSRAPAAGQTARPPVAPAAAQAQANQALASCLGEPYQVVAGLFAGATLPGQAGAAKSPTFQTGSDPNVTMSSTATVLASAAGLQTLEAPFTKPNFGTCFGQYQSSLASAAVPAATAQVQPVTLVAPAGVQAYGYVTTLTIPNQGGEVVGEAFLLGGRIETLLEPSTNGSSIPSAPFTSAFNAVTGRMAAAVNR